MGGGGGGGGRGDGAAWGAAAALVGGAFPSLLGALHTLSKAPTIETVEAAIGAHHRAIEEWRAALKAYDDLWLADARRLEQGVAQSIEEERRALGIVSRLQDAKAELDQAYHRMSTVRSEYLHRQAHRWELDRERAAEEAAEQPPEVTAEDDGRPVFTEQEHTAADAYIGANVAVGATYPGGRNVMVLHTAVPTLLGELDFEHEPGKGLAVESTSLRAAKFLEALGVPERSIITSVNDVSLDDVPPLMALGFRLVGRDVYSVTYQPYGLVPQLVTLTIRIIQSWTGWRP